MSESLSHGYPYGKGPSDGFGAGIGGGQDGSGATVTVTGGTVEVWSGEDASSTNGSAIGSHQGDGHRGTLKIEGDLRVYGWAKSDSAKESLTYGERVPGCFYRTRARVEPCTDHNYVDGKCKWCGHAQ